MQGSKRIADVTQGAGDGWEIHVRARAMEAAGEPVILLTVGDHDIKTDPAVIDAMEASARGGNTGYAPTTGTPALRAAIAKRIETATGTPTNAVQITVTTGGQAAMFFAMNAALDPGDTCLLVDPFYATFPLTIRAAAGRVATVRARADRDFVPDPADIDAALAATGARAILLNSPNNPTGAVYDRVFWEDFAEIARSRDIWVIADELYDTQVYEGVHVSPRSLPGLAERTMVLGSLSKSHAMTGWRIGWLCAPEGVTAHASDFAIAATYGIPGFIQDAALFALQQDPSPEIAIAARYRRRRDAAMAVLQGATGVRAVPARGGMYLMLDIRPTGLNGHAFADSLLKVERVAVMPGEIFGDAAAGHLRAALTIPETQLVDALQRLVRHANELAARRAA